MEFNKKYQSVYIYPGPTSNREAGEIFFRANKLFFKSENIQLELNFSDIQITLAGNNKNLVFFNSKSNPDLSLYTSDLKVLKDPELQNDFRLKEQLGKAKTVRNKILIGILSFAAIIILLISSVFIFKSQIVRSIANKVPIEWEQEMGDKLFNTLSLQYKFIKNDSLDSIFRIHSNFLIKEAENAGYKLDFYFVNDPTINAFALPGGKIVIQSGLVENADSWEELFGVVGHEMAHVTCRHHVRGLINNLGLFVILSTLIGDIGGISGTLINTGGELASLSRSREFEYEADEKGMEYLLNAKVNPNGMITFFEKLKKEQPLDSALQGVEIPDFLSTHPNTDARIQKLKTSVDQLSNADYVKISYDYNQFKELLTLSK